MRIVMNMMPEILIMNEFTKDELNYLNDLMSRSRVNPCFIDDSKLQEKIKSLIENYCQHINSNISFNCEDCELIL